MTRAEHMAWCKERALAYVDEGDLAGALGSFASDVTKHPETDVDAVHFLVMAQGMPAAAAGDGPAMRSFLEGFA